MPLSSLVAEVKRTPVSQKQIVYKMPAPRFIDADAFQEEKKQEVKKSATSADWRECKYLREVNNTYYCNYFMSKCAREKCNGKLPLLAQKKR